MAKRLFQKAHKRKKGMRKAKMRKRKLLNHIANIILSKELSTPLESKLPKKEKRMKQSASSGHVMPLMISFFRKMMTRLMILRRRNLFSQ